MTQATTEYKTDETQQGAVVFGLSEYLSRPCRMKLVNALYDQLSFEIWEKKNFERRNGQPVNRRETAYNAVSGILGVHRETVYRWIHKGYQACNVNAEKLITATLKHCPERALELLEEDMETHRFWFSGVSSEVQQGAVVSQPEVVA